MDQMKDAASREAGSDGAREGAVISSHFQEIVGLRLYMATWVAIGHGLQLAGFVKPTNPLTALLLRNDQAVVVFMIISGFVITHLLQTKRELYGPYIVRRFFRLYPVYVIGCVIGYFLADPWVSLTVNAPWRAEPGWAEYAAPVQMMAEQIRTNFWPHLIAHALMLHGAVPNQFLPQASRVFLPAAWSISLEWQFYLLAPLVLLACRSVRGLVAAAAIMVLGLYLFSRGTLGAYTGISTIAGASPYFAIGIASRLAFEKLAALRVNPAAALVVVVVLGAFLLKGHLPITIWLGFYALLLWQKDGSMLCKVFRSITTLKPILLLGEASYSIYLMHRPVQVVLAVVLSGSLGATRLGMLSIQMAAIGVTMILSVLLYLYVEKPFIEYAKRITGARAKAELAEVAAAP